MNPARRLFLNFCSILILSAAVAQPAIAQYRIDTWTSESGLPQNSINDVHQTRDGFIWLTTFGGLVRFDGGRLTTFTTVNSPGLTSGRVMRIFEARDGALWLTTDGQGLVRYADRAFATFTTKDGLPDNRIHVVFEDENGTLLVDSDRGLAAWNHGRFTPHKSAAPSYGDRTKTLLSRTSDGVIWYRDESGIHKYQGGRVMRTLAANIPARRLFEDRRGRVWIETLDRQLACFENDRLRSYGTPAGISGFITASMSEDRDGNVWFGLRGEEGLVRFDGRGFSHYGVADGLPGDNVGTVIQDREGTLWVPTEGGLARLTERPITAHSRAEGLASDNTYPIFRAKNGDVLIGGWKGLTRYRDGRFTDISRDVGIATENIMSIGEARDGALWIGTWGGGVRRIVNGTSTTPAGVSGAPGAVVRVIYQGRGPELWFGGLSGLTRYERGVFRAMTRADGFPGGDVQVLFEDRAGALWIGTDGGVSVLRDGTFTSYGAAEGLTGAPVRAIHEDAAGSMWLGTYDGGLFRFRDGRFVRFTTNDGLASNGAFRIIEDERGWFWISSNAGVYRVARAELDELAAGKRRDVTSVLYGRRDGMLDIECNGGGQPSGIREPSGRIWFPTQKGVVSFDPARMGINSMAPPVVITDVLVAEQSMPSRDRVEIRSGPTALEVRYAGLTFIRPELSRFRYRLEGLQPAWTDGGEQRFARYAQLPYGTFRFHVIAANRDGVWNTEGAFVDIVVVPPFWRTNGFLAIALFAAAGLGYMAHRRRLTLLHRQQAVREAFARQLVDTQERERKRIAAGLHDGISQTLIMIKNWALLGQRAVAGDHAAQPRLSDIEQAASGALTEVREVVHDLSPSQLEMFGLGPTITELANKVGDASGIVFTTSIAALGARLSKDAEINVYRVIQEAINNIVKHAGATRASVEMSRDDGRLNVIIRDNGRGFQAEQEPRPTGTGGFGILNMSERMRMIGGRADIESSPGQGTTIRITLPRGGVDAR